jgi:hypothetical protein
LSASQKLQAINASFITGQAVDRAPGVVPGDEAVLQQTSLDRRYGGLHAWVVGREKTYERQQQQTRIEIVRAIELHKGVQVCVEAFTVQNLTGLKRNTLTSDQRC